MTTVNSHFDQLIHAVEQLNLDMVVSTEDNMRMSSQTAKVKDGLRLPQRTDQASFVSEGEDFLCVRVAHFVSGNRSPQSTRSMLVEKDC